MGRGRPRSRQPRLPLARLGPGARPAIPPKANEAPVACPEPAYNNRKRVERLWDRLEEWRVAAARFEKTAASFLGVRCVAATAD